MQEIIQLYIYGITILQQIVYLYSNTSISLVAVLLFSTRASLYQEIADQFLAQMNNTDPGTRLQVQNQWQQLIDAFDPSSFAHES